MKKCIFLSIPASIDLDDPIDNARVEAVKAELASRGYEVISRAEFESGFNPDVFVFDGWTDDDQCVNDVEAGLAYEAIVYTESNFDY